MNMMAEVPEIIQRSILFPQCNKIVILHNSYYQKTNQNPKQTHTNSQKNGHTVYLKDKCVHPVSLYMISCFPNRQLMGKKL